MINFYRDFGSVCIRIKIEEITYYKHKNIFDVLFFTYMIYNESKKSNNIKVIYIDNSHIDIDNSHTKHYDYYYLCDIDKDNWVNALINFLEECYEKILMCTIFHGSCVMLKNKGIMLLGKTRAGKSTLTYHLVHQNNAFYLDDDVVYMLNNTFVGFNTPMCMRDKYIDNSNLLEVNTNIDDITRYTYDVEYHRKISNVVNMDYIIFPKYKSDVDFQLSEINGYTLISNIIANIKGTKNMITTFKDVSTCFSNAKAYEIEYSNCYKVSEFLETLLLL